MNGIEVRDVTGSLRSLPDGFGGQVPLEVDVGSGREVLELPFVPTGPNGRTMFVVADGRDVVVNVGPQDFSKRPDQLRRRVVLSGEAPGSIEVVGPGNASAVRTGSGDGHARRSCPGPELGEGGARRSGGGHGNAEAVGMVKAGWIERLDSGDGHARVLCSGELGDGAWTVRGGAGRGYCLPLAAGPWGGDELPGFGGAGPLEPDQARDLVKDWGRAAFGEFGNSVPRRFSPLVGALVAPLVSYQSSDVFAQVAAADDLESVACGGCGAEDEWERLPLVMTAVRALVGQMEVGDGDPLRNRSEARGLVRGWTRFVAAVRGDASAGGWRDGLGALRAELDALPKKSRVPGSLGWEMEAVSDAFLCLEVVAGMEGPDEARLLAASGYVWSLLRAMDHWDSMEVVRKLDFGTPIRAAVADAAERERERVNAPGP